MAGTLGFWSTERDCSIHWKCLFSMAGTRHITKGYWVLGFSFTQARIIGVHFQWSSHNRINMKALMERYDQRSRSKWVSGRWTSGNDWSQSGIFKYWTERILTWVSLWVFVGLAMGIGSSVLIKQGSTIGWGIK